MDLRNQARCSASGVRISRMSLVHHSWRAQLRFEAHTYSLYPRENSKQYCRLFDILNDSLFRSQVTYNKSGCTKSLCCSRVTRNKSEQMRVLWSTVKQLIGELEEPLFESRWHGQNKESSPGVSRTRRGRGSCRTGWGWACGSRSSGARQSASPRRRSCRCLHQDITLLENGAKPKNRLIRS